MKRYAMAAAATLLAAATAGCVTGSDNAAQTNQQYSKSKVYIGALTCNVAGGTGYVIGSSKDLDCVYLTKDGVSQAYAGRIRKVGLDLGYTKDTRMTWKVFQLGGLVGSTLTTDPMVLASGFVGEAVAITADASGGGNWLYGGANNQIVLQATDMRESGGGYDVAYAIANIELKPKP